MSGGRADGPPARHILARAWWLHPLLLAAFPVLFLFAANIGEQITVEPLFAPLALAVAGAGALLLLSAGVAVLLGGSVVRAGLVATIAVVLFFSYGHVWQAVEPTLHLHRYLLVAWIAIGVVGLVFALRARLDRIHAATAGLNVVALLLVALNLVPIALQQLEAASVRPAGAGPSATAADSFGARPDIWYLVFDRYAGADALASAYGYDNTPFLEELERRGFRIAEHSTANYPKTAHSLASVLNMDYLDVEALADAAAAPDDWTPLYRQLQGSHAVERFLHDLGYTYLHLGVRRGATYTNSAADRTFLYSDQTEFSSVLRETTLLSALENLLGDDAPGGYVGLYGNHSLYQFGTLELLAGAREETPRFIFAHFLLPHPPYAFNADGTWVTEEQAAARSEAEQYIEQLRFTNDRILQLLDALPQGDDAPIVLLQSDEGPFPERYARDEAGFRWSEATPEELLQKYSILAAYRAPGAAGDALAVYPEVTAVNSFRLIFNAAFGTDLPLLDDRNWAFVDGAHIYEMIEITDRLRAAR